MPDGPVRKILHVDADAFFASVEQRDDPSLRGRPVAVGGSSARGVVAAASYEARAFGVRSAMPMRQAMERCRELVVVPPRFDVYRAVSREMHAVFHEHTPVVEPVSLDEAYLDVTTDLTGATSATAAAERIRAEIRSRTGLTVSAGVSSNKFLAKLGSGMRKPDAMTVIRPERAADLLADLEVGRFHGIGPATAARMEALGIRTGRDLRVHSPDFLARHFGKAGPHYRDLAWGIDDRPVVSDRERRSYGSENTFEEDLREGAELDAELDGVVARVWEDRLRVGRDGRTLTLKARYRGFDQVTRSRTLARPVSEREVLAAVARELLASLSPLERPLRLVGLSVSNLASVGETAVASSQMALI